MKAPSTPRSGGFTLIELMIVIAIIATVVGMGFVRFRRVVSQAETVVSVRGLREIFEGVMQFEQTNGHFPDTLDELGWGPLPDTWGNPYQYLNFQSDEAAAGDPGNGNGGGGANGSAGSGSAGSGSAGSGSAGSGSAGSGSAGSGSAGSGSAGSGSAGSGSAGSGSAGSGSAGSGGKTGGGKGLSFHFGGLLPRTVWAQSGGSGNVNQGAMRKDRFLVPINTWFDLYSMGPDGASKPPLNAAESRDDIIVANDGEFIGPASEF